MSQRSARPGSSARAGWTAALALALAPMALTGAASPAIAAVPAVVDANAAASSAAVSSAAATPAASCTITAGTLTWGFKESFRSYISGTIAKGAWEPTGGATYETPNFGWSAATGEFDPATLVGDVHYVGGVHFTGHNGLLDTTIANPTLRFAADGSGALLLDITSLSMDDAMAGNTENVASLAQVPIVSLDLAAAPLQSSGDSLTVTGTAVPTTMTAEGFAAFGSYDAGTPFDPVTFSFTVECPEPEPTPEPTTEASAATTPTPVAASADGPADLSWIPWLGGGILAAAIIVWAVLRRRTSGATGAETGPANAGDPAGPASAGDNGAPSNAGDNAAPSGADAPATPDDPRTPDGSA
ncbi:HtaA domain-containing protein [Microbacterium sp. cx-55]|uniref:HtaA domain-containing protein n=1 Tax=Microbacterium sp. cx-55 TaxID=2875948 RepID=UPI001CC1AF33|nr:HtaA domain-containing protein [Microbacterium sp. cx-55]MBZ4487354.1 HtaA domain-containing protein [Microbacterium sp. cx-55]UGB35374.1 HtaA domain-containing protein [Microbacterium sp. cx-55]